MKDYLRTTIADLANLINYLDVNGCLTQEDRDEYARIMRYYEHEGEVELGAIEIDGHHSFIEWMEDGDETSTFRFYSDSPDEADNILYDASHVICFADCSNARVRRIVIQGYEVEYVGWHPGMLYEFRDVESGKIIWSQSFPNWNH